MRKFLINCVNLILLINLCACASTELATPLQDETIIENVKPQLPDLDDSLFGEPVYIEQQEDTFALTEDQKTHFLEYLQHSSRQDKPKHKRVYEYLKDIGLKFEYSNITSNAENTLRTKTGNCMSLAVLTSALAKTAEIEIKYQLVNRVPIYQEFGSVIFNAKHIRSIIYEPLLNPGAGVNIWRGKAIIDYYPSRYSYVDGNVSEVEFIGMYYRNVAAEALGREDYQSSYWLLKRSLEIDPEDSEAINSLAVLHRRVGDNETAEALYKYGIKHARNKIVLLKNYQVLLELQNRTDDAAKVSRELEGLEDLNPFRWLHAGNEAYAENNLDTALTLYKKVIELAPYLHQGYFGIAKSEYKRGNFISARKALEKAQEEAFDQKAKSLYEAKLYALKKERYN